MNESNIQADLLETARSLILRDPDRFSVAALCRETGLSRNKMRQYFPTKAALMTALLEKEPGAQESGVEMLPDENSDEEILHDEISHDDTPHDIRSGAEIIGESWIERRFRVFERALALLENKTEGATVEQSRALAMIEERLSGPVSASLAELPPIVDSGKLPLKISEEASGPVAGQADQPAPVATPAVIAQSEPILMPPLEFQASAQVFYARKKLQTILENAPAAIQTADEKPKFLEGVPPWLLFCAGLACMVLLLSVLFAISNARNAPTALAQRAQITVAAQKPAAAPQKPIAAAQNYDASAHVVVIDATGTNPQSITPDIDMQAERGDAHAKVEAALAYLRGQGVEADAGAAMRWTQTAAAQGDATAQFILGSLYAKGMAPDPQHAFKWYAAAAAKGNVKAMHNLALAYLNGDGVEKNAATAIEWFTKAANGGYVDAAMNLAVLYDRGEGVGRSPQDALHWYDNAAALGDSEATHRAKILRAQLSRVAGR
jgi:AcrR family transcriptional regulator